MATREIIRMGNPILATMAQPIQPDDVATLPDVIQDMIDTMRAANGVGLAAPQIGLSMRLIVFEIPKKLNEEWNSIGVKASKKAEKHEKIYINENAGNPKEK